MILTATLLLMGCFEQVPEDGYEAPTVPTLGEPAEQLAECAQAIATDAGADAECFALVIAACLPSGEEMLSEAEREECFLTAQAQLAAVKEYQEVPPPPAPKPTERLSPLGVFLVFAGTSGLFALIARRISRRVKARNRRSFEAQLGDLEKDGFRDSPAPELPTLRGLPEFVPVHALVRRSDGDAFWLLELEHANGSQNECWPVRAAMFDLEIGAARGVIRARGRNHAPGPSSLPSEYLKHNIHPTSIGDLLLDVIAPALVAYWPELAVELRQGRVIVFTVPEPLGAGGEPLRLQTLADAAERIRTLIRDPSWTSQ